MVSPKEKNKKIIQPISNLNFVNSYIPGTILIAKPNENFEIIEANDEYFNLLGYTPEEISDIFQNYGYLTLHPDERDNAAKQLMEQIAHNPAGVFAVNCKLIHKTEGYKDVFFTGRMGLDSNNEPILYFLLTDVTNHISTLKKLDEERHFSDIIASFTDDYFFDYNTTSKSVRFSKNLAERLSIPKELENFPECLIERGLISKEEVDKYRPGSDYKKNMKQKILIKDPLKNKNYWFSYEPKFITDTEGVVIHVVAKLHDITKYVKQLQDLTQKATHDDLTGLYNMSAMIDLVTEYIETNKKTASCAFCFIDIDNFKSINDTFGHIYGDNVLKEISQFLKKSFRTCDYIARFGGDEFVVFLKDIISDEVLSNKLHTFCADLKRVYNKDGKKIEISASIGVSLYPQNGENFETLCKNADTALYRIKRTQKGTFSYY